MEDITVDLNTNRFPRGMLEFDKKLGLIIKKPAIFVANIEKGGKKFASNTIAVGWYDSERRGQFEFHLTMPLNTFYDKYMTHLEGEVIFLGQVKNWPADQIKTKNDQKMKKILPPESYIVNWMIPNGIGIYNGRIIMPAPTAEVILIGHREYGLLRPENYSNFEIRNQILKSFGWLLEDSSNVF
jgi:hypothetical protein